MLGVIKWLNVKKNFGFIENEKDKDILIPFSILDANDYEIFKKNQHVKFDIKQGNDGLEAINIVSCN